MPPRKLSKDFCLEEIRYVVHQVVMSLTDLTVLIQVYMVILMYLWSYIYFYIRSCTQPGDGLNMQLIMDSNKQVMCQTEIFPFSMNS